eukprot:1182844-Karenia_brevis.AAC.1
MEQRGAKLSPKSAIMASDKDLREGLASNLSRDGIKIRSKDHTRDLGLDATLGAKRKLSIRKARQKKAKIRFCKIRKLSKVTTRARGLASTGAKP